MTAPEVLALRSAFLTIVLPGTVGVLIPYLIVSHDGAGNPMYEGVFILLLGQAAFFQSLALVQYTALWAIVVHAFVVLYEEPSLRRRFGDSYERYRLSVPRWLPRRPTG